MKPLHHLPRVFVVGVVFISEISIGWADLIDISLLSGSQWRSSDILLPGWESPTYDDSSWAFARSPYPIPTPPQTLIPGTSAQYVWHDPTNTSDGTTGTNQAFFRSTITIGNQADVSPLSGRASISVDDDYSFFVNGQLAFENKDGGNAEIVDTVDFSSLLHPGINTFAIQAADGSFSSPYDRLFERVLFDGEVKTVPTVFLLNGQPVSTPPSSLVSGDTLLAQGNLNAPINIEAGGKLVGTDQLLIRETVELTGGSVEMDSGKSLQLNALSKV
jgi:hypothetical protein